MSSQINPNSINQNYPSPGVDNNSQGFRDNFSYIKNNFAFAKAEMDDLLSKVVTKAPLLFGATPTLADNNFNGSTISNVVFKGCALNRVDLGTSTSTTAIILDFAAGDFQTLQLSNSGNIVTPLNFINIPVNGTYVEVKLRVTVNDITRILQLASSATYINNSTIGFDPVTRNLSFNSVGTYEFIFSASSLSGVTTVSIKKAGNGALAQFTDSITLSSGSNLGNLPLITVTNTSGINVGGFGPAIKFVNSVAAKHSYLVGQYQSTASNFFIANGETPFTQYFTIDQTGNVGINTTTPGYQFTVNGQPAANGYTAFTNYSDSRLKENVVPISDTVDSLEKISKLNPVSFNYNELSGYDEASRAKTVSGFIAQELQEVFPDMVGTVNINDVDYLDTNLTNLTLHLVNAVKELKKIVDLQASQIADMNAKKK